MKRKNLETAKKMAKEAGFHDVREVKGWNGYQLAYPLFTDGEVHDIGPVQYLLAKSGSVRWAGSGGSEGQVR
ncbi:MAG: hypothetical protein PUD47_04355 [Bacteroidales bacterium]|nr:hypothetical protein [Bacteroidales bacterium]